MSDQEVRGLMETAGFGIEVEAFLNSPIGRYLVRRAHQEVDEAVEGLKKADPTDVRRITELQNLIHRAESFDSWLAEAVQEGWAAEQALRES